MDYPKGEPENPIERQELSDKFYSLLNSAGLGRRSSERIWKFIWGTDNENVEVAGLLELINSEI